jgi:hypothetical protein
MAKTLDNFSMYLWQNPEGLHITLTTNFRTPNEKRSFFSFGKQTYKSWRAFNLYQPEPLREYFNNFKETYNKQLKTTPHDYWISKLAVNTGLRGRRTAPGCCILQNISGNYNFVIRLADHQFEGDFDDSNLSPNQRSGAKGVCLGSFIWKNDDIIDDYAEAF